MKNKGLLEPLVQKVLSMPYAPRGGRGKLRQSEAILLCMYAWEGRMTMKDLEKFSLAWRGNEKAMCHNFNPFYGNKTAENFYGTTKFTMSYWKRDCRFKGFWYRVPGRNIGYSNSIAIPGFKVIAELFSRPEFVEFSSAYNWRANHSLLRATRLLAA